MDRSLCPSPDVSFDFRSGTTRSQRCTPTAQPETIRLSDILHKGPNETLRKVHAQSSAETSGLGDSLQRIHALSSTETSGYGGETGEAPSPTGQVSPYASIEDVPRGDTATAAAASAAAVSPSSSSAVATAAAAASHHLPSSTRRSSVWVVEKDRARHGYDAGNIDDEMDRRRRSDDRGGGYVDSSPPGHVSEEYYEDCFDDRKWQQIYERARQTKPDNVQSIGSGQKRRSTDQDDEDLMETGGLQSGRSGGERRGSMGGDGLTGGAGQGTMEGHFLGRKTQSAWLRWSHERRASFKRKVEFIEQRQNELQKIRMSSPVRKARKESMRFVSPELEDQHLTFNDDAVTLAHPAFPFDIPPPAVKKPSRKQDIKEETKLTLAQWNILVAFWEHDVFVRSRYIGLLFGLASIILLIVGLVTNKWLYIDGHSIFGACHLGLWQVCSSSYDNCTFIEYDKWQIAVIAMTMFSATFDSMALTLSVLGICSSSLPKKIYYYHSAGEIHLLCAIGCSITLLLFPMTIDSEASSPSMTPSTTSSSMTSWALHSFGYGYFVVCGATACLCVAAFSMCLDDLIRNLARGLCNRNSSKV